MMEGKNSILADYFQTLDWLLNEICITKQKFEKLYQESLQRKRYTKDSEDFVWLTATVEVFWQKAEEYFDKADDTAAYYTVISLNPILKHEWYKKVQSNDEEKQPWIMTASKAVKELQLEEYKGKYSVQHLVANSTPKPVVLRKEKAFTSVRNHKYLKISY